MSDRPDETDDFYEPADEDDGGDDEECACVRTLVPRTAITARAYLEARAEAERILALPCVVQVRAAMSRYRCLGCNDPLPAGRGGHCDACIEWDDNKMPSRAA